MTPADLENLRLSLLRFLTANTTEFGLNEPLLLAMAKAEGRSQLTRDQVATELRYLEEKALVVRVVKAISPELKSWRISASGRDYMAERGIE